MKSKIISIRLSLEKLTDKKVYEVLSRLPPRRKSEHIKNAIIAYYDFEHLIKVMKQAFIEAMDEIENKQAEKKNQEDEFFNDYLKSL